MTTTTLTEDAFIAQFQPEAWPNGELYRQFDWADEEDFERIQQAQDERRLWTMVEDDHGNPALVQGFARVNRLYYVICAVPTPEGVAYTITMDT